MSATIQSNLRNLRKELDLSKLASYLENPNSKGLLNLIVPKRNGTIIFIRIGSERLSVQEGLADFDSATEHKSIDETLTAIRKLYALDDR